MTLASAFPDFKLTSGRKLAGAWLHPVWNQDGRIVLLDTFVENKSMVDLMIGYSGGKDSS